MLIISLFPLLNLSRDFWKDLVKLAGDPLYPVIVRATALSLLTAYPGEKTFQAFVTALMDDEALIRWAAQKNMYLPDRTEQVKHLIPLLYDPVLAVRDQSSWACGKTPTLCPLGRGAMQAVESVDEKPGSVPEESPQISGKIPAPFRLSVILAKASIQEIAQHEPVGRTSWHSAFFVLWKNIGFRPAPE